MNGQPTLIATRGSALALAQANLTLAACREKFPKSEFELKIIKTTGDKLQTASLAKKTAPPGKGLFTKELEAALLKKQADLAVHSLKDLPTELPPGLRLCAVAGKREDVRDVFVYKKIGKSGNALSELPAGLVVGTGSSRRSAQLLALRPDFKTTEIRGNVPTRLKKLAASATMDATILAAAGLARLGYKFLPNRELVVGNEPTGLWAIILDVADMLPCVGQGAIGLEIRSKDEATAALCAALNDFDTFQCVTAERSFLQALGGGCQTPVGAFARIVDSQLHLQAVSFLGDKVRRSEARGPIHAAEALGEQIAAQLKPGA